MMKPILILQAFGMGDCIWAQSIANSFILEGYDVIWPVKNEYFDGLCRAYPKIKWVPESIVKPELFQVKEKSEIDGVAISPIRWSDSYMNVPYKDVMIAKYMMYNMDWKTWRDYAMPERNHEREESLMRELKIATYEPYNLLSLNFGSGKVREVPISVSNGLRNIKMDFVPGYSIFDWCGIIERARTIHAVSSSSLYLFEILNIRAEEVHLYTRKPIEKNLDYVKPILSKNYILHE